MEGLVLILTRKEDQSVVFPNCGIVVHVLSVRGRTIKLGFEAPKEVEVLRGELLEDGPPRAPGYANDAKSPVQDRNKPDRNKPELSKEVHDLRNKLNNVTLAIHAYNELKSRGKNSQADALLDILVDNLAQIDRDWGCNDVGRVLEESGVYKTSADSNAALTTLLTSSPTSSPTASKRPLRLLVVDDDPNERELLAGLLEMNGCYCATAASGNEALAMIENNAIFDFALLDMHMPDRDGASTLRAIRANDRFAKLKVFSVSGTSPSECGATIGGDGFDGWLPKPLNPKALWNHLQESMRRENSAT